MVDVVILPFSALPYIFSLYCLISARKFGYNNRYTCHCSNNRCDVTGRCVYASCDPGWYGSTCQKENVALNKPTDQNTYYKTSLLSSYAVDGDTTHRLHDLKCSHVGEYKPGIPNYWQVDLQHIYPIRDIKIYIRDTRKDRLRGFYINTDNSSNTETACREPDANIPSDIFTITVKCEGRYLRFSNTDKYRKSGFVNLCEIQVYVCSTGTYGLDCTSFCYCNSPTDRCTDGLCPNGCVSGYTGDSCNTSCYGDSCMFMCSDRKCSNSTSQCNFITGECNGGCEIGYKQPDCHQPCDIGVNYGIDCSGLCSDRHCFNKDSPCDQLNGTCDTNGCNTGYKGHDCTQVCYSGFYGDGCNQTCKSRECKTVSNTCNHEDGSCGTEGCLPGYQLKDCSQKCTGRTYGSGCTFNCDHRNCENNTNCDIRIGKCEGLCKDGFELDDCTQSRYKIDKKEPFGAIIGSVVAVGFVVGIAIIVVIVVRRRKAAHHNSNGTDDYTLTTRNSDDHTYTDIDAGIIYEDIDSVSDDKSGEKAQENSKQSSNKRKTTSNATTTISRHEQDNILSDFSEKYKVEITDVRQRVKLKAVLFDVLGVQSSTDLELVEAADLSDVLTPIQLRWFTLRKHSSSTRD